MTGQGGTVSLAELTGQNSSFSRVLPGLQLAIDSHSLGEFKTCPRRYYYSIICGWQPRELSVHLTFGILMHSSRERYDHGRSQGEDHDQALSQVLAWLLEQTWNSALRRPWASDHPTKNRLTLIRTVVWYLDSFGESDPLETAQLASGKPAVELSFQFETEYTSQTTGEPWVFCGHIDRVARLNGQPYILDLKTTSWSIDAGWFRKFTPFNQFSMYCLAGQVVWKEPIQGLIVDGCQVLASGSRFERGMVPRPVQVIDEWYAAQASWLQVMESSAVLASQLESDGQDISAAWPMNEMSCGNYSRADGSRGGCEFREVCSRPPASRPQWLKTDFIQRVWDPLQRRGEI